MLLLLLLLGVCGLARATHFEHLSPILLKNTYDAFESKLDASKGLEEFTPIRNQITQSEIQYYLFSVNALTGLGVSYEYLVFITGNICLQPADEAADANQTLTVYYLFNLLMFQDIEASQMVLFDGGYFSALADLSVTALQTILYIAVRAPESTNTLALWLYEIGVSQNDLVYQWDTRTFATVVDTDHESALVVTGNLTQVGQHLNISTYNALLLSYLLLVYTEEAQAGLAALNNSWCAINNGPHILAGLSWATSYTTRGGGLHQQFEILGLNASTTYVAYLVTDLLALLQGGVLYKPFTFRTMLLAACRLVYDLSFCTNVAYLVPALLLAGLDTVAALQAEYDAHAEALFANFSKALQQVACDAPSDQVFLPLGLCDQCAELYRNWLCLVLLPRCSTRNVTGYIHRTKNASRSLFIDDVIVPPLDYYEVLPCLNVCQVMARDCPADFDFVCPLGNDTIRRLYYWDEGGDYASCNFVGTFALETSGAAVLRVLWTVLAPALLVMML